MRGEFIDLAGARLYYYAAGSRGAGEPVVFLHGFGTSGHLWSDVVSLMPAGHRLVVVDLLGWGRSDPPAGRDLSLRGHGERVLALLDALGVREACIVGHGLGGGVAQWLALEAPSRVSRLALVSSVSFGDWPTRDVRIARLLIGALRRLPPAWVLSMVRAEMERGHGDRARASHALDKFARPFAGEEGRAALCAHIAALDPAETLALSHRLKDITQPCTVLWGASDPYFPLRHATRLAEAIPDARLEVVPGARHFLPEESPREVSDAVAHLLARR